MRQYVTMTMKAWEKLKYIKRYRTPIATRAFARVYIFLHPIPLGPLLRLPRRADAQRERHLLDELVGGYPVSTSCAYVYACALSVLTSLAMTGLFNVRYRLEDPFCPDADLVNKSGSDQIHITQELAEVMRAVSMEIVDADQNSQAGGGPSRSCYPPPEGSCSRAPGDPTGVRHLHHIRSVLTSSDGGGRSTQRCGSRTGATHPRNIGGAALPRAFRVARVEDTSVHDAIHARWSTK